MRNLLLFLTVIFVLAVNLYSLEIPPLKGRVMDLAGVLTPSQVYRLEEKLYLFEKQTTNQIAVLIIPSLKEESLEDFSIRVAEKWKLGAEGRDNGVLLLISIAERKIRIEVGYGLEGSLPDIVAFNIIRTQIAPYFKKGLYYEGINAGIDGIIGAIRGEFFAEPEREISEKEVGKSIGSLITFIILMILFLLPGRRRMGWFWAGVGLGSFFRGSSGGGFGGFSGGGGGFGGGGASGGW